MNDRLDYILSNWIFIWFLIYYSKLLNVPNPKFALIIGLMLSLPILIILIYKNNINTHNIKFSIVILITKIIPLYILRNNEINIVDIIAFGLLFILNIVYISIFEGGIDNCVKILIKRATNGIEGRLNNTLMYCFNKFF